MPETPDQTFNTMPPVPERNRHGLLIGAGALVVLLSALGAWVYLTYTPSRGQSPYQNGVTPFSVLVRDNRAFAEADLLFKDGRYIEARAKYEEALQTAQDEAQKSQIQIKIAHTYLFARELVEAVKRYKEIANNPTYGDLVRAYAVTYMGMAYDYNGDEAVRTETFKGEPYASMYDPNDVALSYRHLYEYASSIHPLALSELRVATWYVLDAAGKMKTLSAEEKNAYRARIDTYLQNAETDMARLKNDPNERAVMPEALKRKAIVLGYLAIGGFVPHEQAEQAFSEAQMLAATLNLGEDGFIRYFHALYLSFVAGRENDVVTILSPLYRDRVYANTNISSFLTSERENKLGHKQYLVKLAGIDPAFKNFLISLGWTAADFK